MIVLWGLEADPPLAAVYAALQQAGHPVVFLDQQAVLETSVELHVNATLAGTLRIGHLEIDLGAVSAVYLRPQDSRRIPAIERAGAGSPAWRHALQLEDTLLSWAELTPALVVNRPGDMAANHSKPYQSLLIRSSGFAVPDTLVTTNPAAARNFWEEHGTVVYKSVSGVRSIVSRLAPDHLSRFEDIAWCPTQFQQHIPGTDYRVHVVGDKVFACRIVSAADDYRYAPRQGAEVAIRPWALPEECADRCRKLAASMQLHVAGVDLRRTPDGAWYCFEVNPSPGFTYFQEASGQHIDAAIAQMLMEAEARR